jgi:hypothetical protein
MDTRRLTRMLAVIASAAIVGCGGGGGGSTTGSGPGTQTGGGAGVAPTGDPLRDKAIKECFDQAKQLPAGPDRDQANQDCKEAAD